MQVHTASPRGSLSLSRSCTHVQRDAIAERFEPWTLSGTSAHRCTRPLDHEDRCPFQRSCHVHLKMASRFEPLTFRAQHADIPTTRIVGCTFQRSCQVHIMKQVQWLRDSNRRPFGHNSLVYLPRFRPRESSVVRTEKLHVHFVKQGAVAARFEPLTLSDTTRWYTQTTRMVGCPSGEAARASGVTRCNG